ncbi:hypothetical protein MN173_11235, partial [Streptococcus agalactiae]|nr:hypothetical protein [Streptococcus agalactiae]
MCNTVLTERLRLQPVELTNVNDFLEFSSDSETVFYMQRYKANTVEEAQVVLANVCMKSPLGIYAIDFLRNKIWYNSSMNYEASKQLTDVRFKRLVGVQRTTFEEML